MKCPHFEKVNFQRIKQVKTQQGAFEQQTADHLNNSIFSIQSISQQIYNVPEEGIDRINNFKTNSSHQHKHFFCESNQNKEELAKQGSKIKMPKQMNIKKMIVNSQLVPKISNAVKINQEIGKVQRRLVDSYLLQQQQMQNSQQILQQGQIPSEHQYYHHHRKNPHILISRTSMMTHQNFQIFNGIVFLTSKQSTPYQCQFKDYVIKISKQQKIKYFIELEKVRVSLRSLEDNDKGVSINLNCKNKSGQLSLYFISPFQKDIFKQVFLNCIKKIQSARRHKKALLEDKQNVYSNVIAKENNHKFSSSMTQQSDSQEQQSQILNQQNYLGQCEQQKSFSPPLSQLSESISSISMNSYQGDSLVFQTQRMFFQQVKQTGNTFDILLFKNKSLMSKFQRIFTNSDYDHTAMLLRTANNQLLMLQATSNSGVAIYTFSSLLKIDRNKYFSRIGLRRYKGQKDFMKISRLQNFIRKTVGKKYKFDPMYLIKSEANQQKQTFFCSQLVAQALQDVGILSNQVPSFKYLPKHFAQQTLNNKIIDGKYSETIILE